MSVRTTSPDWSACSAPSSRCPPRRAGWAPSGHQLRAPDRRDLRGTGPDPRRRGVPVRVGRDRRVHGVVRRGRERRRRTSRSTGRRARSAWATRTSSMGRSSSRRYGEDDWSRHPMRSTGAWAVGSDWPTWSTRSARIGRIERASGAFAFHGLDVFLARRPRPGATDTVAIGSSSRSAGRLAACRGDWGPSTAAGASRAGGRCPPRSRGSSRCRRGARSSRGAGRGQPAVAGRLERCLERVLVRVELVGQAQRRAAAGRWRKQTTDSSGRSGSASKSSASAQRRAR